MEQDDIWNSKHEDDSPSVPLLSSSTEGINIQEDNDSVKKERKSKAKKKPQQPAASNQKNPLQTTIRQTWKLFFILAIFSLGTFFLVCSKYSTIRQATKPHNANTLSETMVMILVPIFIFFWIDVALWWIREKRPIKKDPQRIKSKFALFLALGESGCESMALCTFMFVVLPTMSWVQATVYMHSLPMGSFILAIVSKIVRRCIGSADSRPNWQYLLIFGCVILSLSGLAWFAYTTTSLPGILFVPPILSTAYWWKNFLPLTSIPPMYQKAITGKRYGAAALKAFFKMVFIIVFGIVYSQRKYGIDSNELMHGFFQNIFSPTAFNIQVFSTFMAYFCAVVALKACLQRVCFAIPLMLTTPITLLFIIGQVGVTDSFRISHQIDYNLITLEASTLTYGGLLWLSSVLYAAIFLFQYMPPDDAGSYERDLFADPGYDAPWIEQSLLLNRSCKDKNISPVASGLRVLDPNTHITFIMTTMYQEGKTEMTNLVKSVKRLDEAINSNREYFEAHITFDNAYIPKDKKNRSETDPRKRKFNPFVNQLLDILLSDEIGATDCGIVNTWYGSMIVVQFPVSKMQLYIHLKDISKKRVKQRKRWSQILYMSVLLQNAHSPEFMAMVDDQAYLLLMDGDTVFSKHDIDMMRTQMFRDHNNTGAVCGRIYPDCEQSGSNPLVWYQKFEYASGHWFQKTTEAVLGTVLCCPGCFTLIRLAALYRSAGEGTPSVDADCAIKRYKVEVEDARDVLMYDQGEDRMLSSILIENGWILGYCPGASAYTYCPTSFKDFFVQRRRWISSTLANMYYVLGQTQKIVSSNRSVSGLFMAYTALNFAGSIFGIATVMLVTLGGLINAVGNYPSVYVITIGLPIFYMFICTFFAVDMQKDSGSLKSKKIELQINVAFALTMVYVVIMAIVLIGVILQMVDHLKSPNAIYLLAIGGIFIITGVIHGEMLTLTYGIIYWFLIPSMYMILMIFAMANLHDHSWGTREGGVKNTDEELFNLKQFGLGVLRMLGWCRESKPVEDVEKNAQPSAQKANEQKWPPKEVEIPFKPTEIPKESEHHALSQQLLDLAKELADAVGITNVKIEKAAESRIEELRSLKNQAFLLVMICTVVWLAIVISVSASGKLTIWHSNAAGLVFLVLFGLVLGVQFIAMLYSKGVNGLIHIAKTPLSTSFCKCYVDDSMNNNPEVRPGPFGNLQETGSKKPQKKPGSKPKQPSWKNDHLNDRGSQIIQVAAPTYGFSEVNYNNYQREYVKKK